MISMGVFVESEIANGTAIQSPCLNRSVLGRFKGPRMRQKLLNNLLRPSVRHNGKRNLWILEKQRSP